MSRRTRTPANGIRAGTIPGQSSSVWHPDTTWNERHPLLFAVTKWFAVVVLSGLLGGIGWLMFDLRDSIRDTGAATKQLPALDERLSDVEREVRDQQIHIRYIREGVHRLERAAGTVPNPPIAPALGPPEPEPAP